ncbi:MAG: hypothetical protein WCV91_00895 [Candidatus Margulisiibacteriota bacterium]
MNNKQIFVFLLAACLLIFFCPYARATDILGARPLGMGGAFVGLADDANAIFSNPAALFKIGKEILLFSTRRDVGREYLQFGGVEKTSLAGFGIGYIGKTDPKGAFSYNSQTVYLSVSKELNQSIKVPKSMGSLSFGMNLKLASRKLSNIYGGSDDVGSNIDLDLSSYFIANEYVSIGATLQNIMNGKTESSAASPYEDQRGKFIIGGALHLLGNNLILSLEDNAFGGEYKLGELSIRGGTDGGYLACGGGIKLGAFLLDYSYAKKDRSVHSVSVSVLPGEFK